MEKRPTICISGLAATGKSTVAKALAKSLKLRYFSGGDALKLVARERGYSPGGKGWWETKEGLAFLGERSRDLELDRLVDVKIVEMCERGGVVVDSWVAPWLSKTPCFSVWLKASERARAARMAGRSRMGLERASKILKKRDRESMSIYRRLYGIRLGEDFSPFHLIVDTTNLSARQVFRIVRYAAEQFV